MRSLVVADTFPWPVGSGQAMRLVMVLEALSSLGPVDLFTMIDPSRTEACTQPEQAPVARSAVVCRSRVHATGRAAGWASLGLPLALAGRDDRAARARLKVWARERYDLAWFDNPATWLAVHALVDAPTVVDLDDLEDDKVLGRMALRPQSRRPAARIRRAVQLEEARRWDRVQTRVTAEANAVCLCTADDSRRIPSGVIVPNGYPAPEKPVGRDGAADPPTFLFAGMLTYPPNADAAHRLVDEVGPQLRAIVPEARIRLVGHSNAQIEALAHPPEVVVAGWVPSMETELAGADAVIVPIRYGSGTRIKILEAFAHRIPVVATAAAAAGLGVRSGEHLLLAESAEDLARAAARVVGDTSLRSSLRDRAQAFFLANFTTEVIQRKIRSLATTIASGQDQTSEL